MKYYISAADARKTIFNTVRLWTTELDIKLICPRTQKEVPLNLGPEQFIYAISALYDLSQSY